MTASSGVSWGRRSGGRTDKKNAQSRKRYRERRAAGRCPECNRPCGGTVPILESLRSNSRFTKRVLMAKAFMESSPYNYRE